MKTFVDLHLCPPFGQSDTTRTMIEKSAWLGYKAVGISFPYRAKKEETEKIRDICNKVGVSLVNRIDLEPRNPAELLKKLRNVRRKTEILAVRCLSKAVARQAAKDRRVDLISFPSTDHRKRFFDSAEAELASGASICLEIEMAPLLYLFGFKRVRLLSYLRRETLIAKKNKVPIIFSSGANDVNLMRKATDYAALSYLFGMESKTAKQAFSVNPHSLIERNRRKLSPSYVAPGVYTIGRREDCPSE